MAANKQALKTRIRSITATKKITSAMRLMATSKLKKQKDLALLNREYAHTLRNTMDKILSNNKGVESVFLTQREDTNPLVIIFTSDMGLCGGYNTNALKKLAAETAKNARVIVIGKKGNSFLVNREYNVVNELILSDKVNFLELSEIAQDALEQYEKEEITSIRVYYTRFENSVTFVPEVIQLLPSSISKTEKDETYTSTIYDPNPTAILDQLIPMYVKSMLYSTLLETKTSEQASRRMAMEQATDNAEELIDNLKLVYNRARQDAITQEISEIVAGADAI